MCVTTKNRNLISSSGVGVRVSVNSQYMDCAIFFISFSNYLTYIKFVNSLQDAMNFVM